MKIFKFFSDCIITLGVSRAIITDITRQKYYLIPLSMGDIIKDIEGKEEQEILNAFDSEQQILQEYFNFLDEHEFIFWCDSVEEAERFPAINTQWDFPGQISNAIVELSDSNYDGLQRIISSLQDLGCQALKINLNNHQNQEEILMIVLKKLEGSLITSLEVGLTYSVDIESRLFNLLVDFPRLLKVTVWSAPQNGISEKVKDELWKHSKIIFTSAPLSNKNCGQVHWGYFTTNIQHYTESLAHNTCLNRKISIDVDGNIKNCPSMKESFGNIKDITLEEAINKPGFKKYWNITKDEITKCKDCEFRHICTDCRAFIDDPEDMYSAPLKCGYNPYTCEWEEWSTNPLKQQAIEYYGMSEMIKQS